MVMEAKKSLALSIDTEIYIKDMQQISLSCPGTMWEERKREGSTTSLQPAWLMRPGSCASGATMSKKREVQQPCSPMQPLRPGLQADNAFLTLQIEI